MENINMEQFNDVAKQSNFGQEVSALIIEIKETVGKKEILNTPTWEESQDTKKLYTRYHNAVDKNSEIMDLIKRCQLEIGIIKQAIYSLDLNTRAGVKFKKQLEVMQNTLNAYLNSVDSYKQSLDRIVRFYEKTYHTFIM